MVGGLTTSVQKDSDHENGHLREACDRGICVADEFDKMNDQDRYEIHFNDVLAKCHSNQYQG